MTLKRTLWLGALILPSLAGLCGAGWFDFSTRQIVIVEGTLSVKDDAERPLAGSLARQTSVWLGELGLRHKLLTDGEITPWKLRGARAVILPYNPYPTPLELKAFQSVIESGGILLVFYGMDPSLATLMQVKLNPYRRAEIGHAWNGFIFDRAACPGLPEIVHQSSDHLVPVVPDSGAARVIARWTDSLGLPTAEPAWVKSPTGFWMSHILQPGDDEEKKLMLLAMLATVLPEAWQGAAGQLLSSSRPFGLYPSLKEAEAELGVPHTPNHPPSNNTGLSAYLDAKASLAELTRRYAERQLPPPPAFIRAIWLDDNNIITPESWSGLAASLTSNRINTVFVHVGNPLTLREPQDLFPPAVITELRAHPGTLHAWLHCLNIEAASTEQLNNLRTEQRVQISDTGAALPWLCPSHPANQRLLAEASATLAKNGIFGGIHLDYIRLKNSSACYCEGCRKRFEKTLGHPLANWPADARSGAWASPYRQWRAGQVTACVAAARDAVKAVNPDLKVSAAVYGATPSCYATVGQDWPGWLDSGLLDFACPMNYTANLKTFSSYLAPQSRLPAANRILPGLGVSSSLSTLTPDQAVAQAILVQRAGFPGYVVFEFSPGVERDVLPYLKLMK